MSGPSEEALRVKLGTISLAAQSKLEEDTAKKEAKADAKADAARKKKLVRPQSHRSFISPFSRFQGLSSEFRSLVISYYLAFLILS